MAMNNTKLDKAGMTASTLCAIHCALMPIIITIAPLVSLSFLASEWVEWALFASSAIIGISSICLGYRKHGDRRAQVVLAIGLALLGAGRIAHENHWGVKGVALLVMGGITVAMSHWINHRMCKDCDSCHSHGE